ncbi:MAG: formate dehydrogenase [Lysobacteraceae bacterium]|nr:MAG: formate dehydrogenase [Xanthomonadaceae bacterium]
MKQDQGQQQEALPADAAGAAPEAERPDPARRSFLKAAPLGALAVVTGSAGAAEAPPAAPPAAPQVKRGYHETEHIRRYYETAAYW